MRRFECLNGNPRMESDVAIIEAQDAGQAAALYFEQTTERGWPHIECVRVDDPVAMTACCYDLCWIGGRAEIVR